MEQIKIRQATQKDVTTLVNIGKETFSETFAASNSAEDMEKYLDLNFNELKIHSQIDNPESLYFIAWNNTDAVGYLKINVGTAQTEMQDATSLEIERIYVKGSHHGKKVGQLLYKQAEETALHRKKLFIWLGVWEENPRAIRFYEKNGFVVFGTHIFKMGEDEQTDIMMKKILV
jgi:ribosomal protein S18 acetylase RimI-like enzyme